MNDEFDARKQYSLKIIQLWLECIDFSHEARKLYLRGEYENEFNYEYIARLTRLWSELYPKVKNKTELKGLEEEFLSFAEYNADVKKYIAEPDKIELLSNVIRDVLDKLKLTSFE